VTGAGPAISSATQFHEPHLYSSFTLPDRHEK
jgi:hypothetical protein